MAKASITLPNGTIVNIEGTPEEVERLLATYSGPIDSSQQVKKSPNHFSQKRKSSSSSQRPSVPKKNDSHVDLMEIVNLIKSCDAAESIETAILDKSDVLHRVLLPMYAVHEHRENAIGLTSGEINKITTQIGVPVTQPNASRCLSGPAKIYLIADKIRVKGQPVRYKLNRRGAQYIQQLLTAPKK